MTDATDFVARLEAQLEEYFSNLRHEGALNAVLLDPRLAKVYAGYENSARNTFSAAVENYKLKVEIANEATEGFYRDCMRSLVDRSLQQTLDALKGIMRICVDTLVATSEEFPQKQP